MGVAIWPDWNQNVYTIVSLDLLVGRYVYSGICCQVMDITGCPHLKLSEFKLEESSNNHFRLHVCL
jgi:hypothetical protein